MELNTNHWKIEGYKQRMTTDDWKKMLLNYEDTITFKGNVRQLEATSLGHDVLEVGKVPLPQESE